MPFIALVSMASKRPPWLPPAPVARLAARIPAGFHARRGNDLGARRHGITLPYSSTMRKPLLIRAILGGHVAEQELSLRRHPECIPNVAEVLNVSAGSLHEIGVSGTRGVLEALFIPIRWSPAAWRSHPGRLG